MDGWREDFNLPRTFAFGDMLVTTTRTILICKLTVYTFIQANFEACLKDFIISVDSADIQFQGAHKCTKICPRFEDCRKVEVYIGGPTRGFQLTVMVSFLPLVLLRGVSGPQFHGPLQMKQK